MPSSITNLVDNTFIFRPFELSDTNNLLKYLECLSPESKKRFGPHPFTSESIANLYTDSNNYKLFIAINKESSYIEAYTVIKIGWLDFEQERYLSYGLIPSQNDCTIAPSVSDSWQGKGLGSLFFDFIKKELLKAYNTDRHFLWGGVQADNYKALAFYKKNYFETLGHFNHNGNNIDMMLNLF